MYATMVLRHNGFARESLVRREVPHQPGGCDWCGGANGHGNLYQYGVERDDRPYRPEFFGKRFCSVSCFESYTE